MAKDKLEMHEERTTSSWREEPNVEFGITWIPSTSHGNLSEDESAMLPTTVFAYPKHRELALTDADHVKLAIEKFWNVPDATDADRDQAFANLQKAAEHYEVEIPVEDWRMLPNRI